MRQCGIMFFYTFVIFVVGAASCALSLYPTMTLGMEMEWMTLIMNLSSVTTNVDGSRKTRKPYLT